MSTLREDPFCQCGYRESLHEEGPELLEFGGTTTRIVQRHPQWEVHSNPHPIIGGFQRSFAFNEAERFHLQRRQQVML